MTATNAAGRVIVKAPSNWWMLFVVTCAWMIDAADSLLYSYQIGTIAHEWRITPAETATIGFLPLVGAVLGGPLFGYVADKFGRNKSLQAAILLVALSCLGVSAAQNPTQMFLVRLFVGVSLGGVWTAGMTLVSETWDAKTRGKAVALVQVGFPLGYLFAALCSYFVTPSYGWRGAYVACAIAAFIIVFLIRFGVGESPIWLKARNIGEVVRKEKRVPLRALFAEGHGKKVVVASLVAFVGMYGYWGVMTWIPSYLSVVGFKANQVPLWSFYILSGSVLGYLVHGALGDRFGRRQAFVWFFIGMAIMSLIFGLLPVYLNGEFGRSAAQTCIIVVGPILSFFTGYFSGYGAYYSELFPTQVRASAAGFSFNIGRVGTATGPGIIGTLAASVGVGGALSTTALAFVVGAILIYLLPETVGAALESDLADGVARAAE